MTLYFADMRASTRRLEFTPDLQIPHRFTGTMTRKSFDHCDECSPSIGSRAVTVAIRYLCIRRQFRDQDADLRSPEINVLEYSTVQIRVLPLLATLFALNYSVSCHVGAVATD